jgi:hypothetical protein
MVVHIMTYFYTENLVATQFLVRFWVMSITNWLNLRLFNTRTSYLNSVILFVNFLACISSLGVIFASVTYCPNFFFDCQNLSTLIQDFV